MKYIIFFDTETNAQRSVQVTDAVFCEINIMIGENGQKDFSSCRIGSTTFDTVVDGKEWASRNSETIPVYPAVEAPFQSPVIISNPTTGETSKLYISQPTPKKRVIKTKDPETYVNDERASLTALLKEKEFDPELNWTWKEKTYWLMNQVKTAKTTELYFFLKDNYPKALLEYSRDSIVNLLSQALMNLYTLKLVERNDVPGREYTYSIIVKPSTTKEAKHEYSAFE